MRISKIINRVEKTEPLRTKESATNNIENKTDNIPTKKEKTDTPKKYINIENLEKGERIYKDAIINIKNYIEKIRQNNQNFEVTEDVSGIIKEIIKEIIDRNSEIMLFVMKSTFEDYIYGHIVNVIIITADLSYNLGYSSDEIYNICLVAFFHDIGMTGFRNIYNKPVRLTESEFTEIRKHPIISKNITEKSGIKEDSILTAVSHIHERINKKGYPLKLNKDEIHEFAKILSVIDVYEAMTHHRSYRKKMEPHFVLRNLIESQSDSFEEYLIKKLIDRLSIYPPGSFVMLNTGEVGRVIKANVGFPTRPVIEVIIDTTKNIEINRKIINLAELPLVNIKEAINWQKLNTIDRRLAFKVSLQDWWIT